MTTTHNRLNLYEVLKIWGVTNMLQYYIAYGEFRVADKVL